MSKSEKSEDARIKELEETVNWLVEQLYETQTFEKEHAKTKKEYTVENKLPKWVLKSEYV